jgi:hypothetical protein
MFKMILGFGILLVIILLTVFILSIQHITFKKKDESKDDDTDGVNKDTDDTDITDGVNKDTDETDITEGSSVDDILAKLIHKEPKDAKCCHLQKFDCSNKSKGCIAGVEKRCGIFSESSCEEPMVECTTLNKKECTSYPENMYCEYDSNEEKCITTTINSHGGTEIPCDSYDILVKNNYSHMQYNCENDLLFN